MFRRAKWLLFSCKVNKAYMPARSLDNWTQELHRIEFRPRKVGLSRISRFYRKCLPGLSDCKRNETACYPPQQSLGFVCLDLVAVFVQA